MSTVEAPARDQRPEIERIKERKDGLDVIHALREAAVNGGFSALSKDDLVLAKWWGVYPQRPEEDGFLMMRVRIPNGSLTAEQLRICGGLANDFGRGLADITTRQCLQFHWLTVEDLPEIFDRLDSCGMTAAQACGDVWRNVVGCPLSGVIADEHFDATPDVFELTRHFLGNRRFSNLPRKFKVAVSSCRHHCAQHEINDLSFVATEHPELGWGYDVWVGGGLGPSARMSRRIDVFVTSETMTEVAEGVTALHRDHGNRLKRTRARIKFLVDEWGAPRFRDALEEFLGKELPRSVEPTGALTPMRDHVGVTPQAEAGLYALGGASKRGRTTGDALIALADLSEANGRGRIRLTNRQNLILLDVAAERLEETKAAMAGLGFPVDPTSFRRQIISCTGIEFCRLAISETKELASELIDHLEAQLGDLDPAVRINVNGCPNACAQYQIADIGLQGALAKKGSEKVLGFQLHLGGRLGDGARFGARTAKPIPAEDARFVLERLLIAYRDEKRPAETFGLWVDRQPEGRLASIVGSPVIANREMGDVVLHLEERASSLVTTDWLAERISDPNVAVIEVSEDRTLYASRHIPGAHELDWKRDLADDDRLGVIDDAALAALLGARGITPETTIVLYGDRANWFSSYAFWLLRRAGHADVRLLDGGRSRWIGEDREITAALPTPEATGYGFASASGDLHRVRLDGVRAAVDDGAVTLVDVRTEDEYAGRTTHDPDFPDETALRAGHIPGAVHVPWDLAVRDDGSFKSVVELRGLFERRGILPTDDVIVYCRIGERAAHTWYVLTELLGYPSVRVYDGSWAEWGNAVDVPIAILA
jgi:sulfite reductase (ferredoxin)